MTSGIAKTRSLKTLLAGIDCRVAGDIGQAVITGLTSDSRKIRPGHLFAAIRGLSVDGHNFLGQAVDAGAGVLLVNRDRPDKAARKDFAPRVPLIEVEDTRIALGHIAAAYYNHPDRECTVIGITGTNGKTTTSYLLEGMLKACGRSPGVIGTVNYRYDDRNGMHVEMAAPFTTPESPTLFGLLREMTDAGVTDVIMEVSSHALAQKRLSGMSFDIAVFTNLSRDHLDFHPDMDHYFSSKRLLFTHYLKPGGRVVIMLAEPPGPAEEQNTRPEKGAHDWGRQMKEELGALYHLKNVSHTIFTCGCSPDCDIHPQNFTLGINGIDAVVASPAGTVPLATPLVGEFNLRNLLCAIGVGIAHGQGLDCISQGLQKVRCVPGRLEKITFTGNRSTVPTAFVDYAHTPEALENVLHALRELQPKRLISIFGCGGDRDQGKRAIMGEIAGTLSDIALATSDNPRSESPEKILAQIEEGLARSPLNRHPVGEILAQMDGRGYDIITNRRKAIYCAIRNTGPGDIVLISGKGHENYQQDSRGRIFFDDRIEAEMQLQAAANLPLVWKLAWIRQITGGRLFGGADQRTVFSSISTDSRSLQPGALFIALQGENFDGKSFAAKAVDKGAGGLLVNRAANPDDTPLDFEPAVPVIAVPDTLFALGQIAAARRAWKKEFMVVAITGSSGKTTVKEMTGAILGLRHSVLKTEGNLNNLVGLPLTLLRLTEEHQVAVLEMGMNRPGEIARLTEIADPDIACIVNVQEAHLEGLGDIQGVARAKNELFAGLKPRGKVIVNLDDEIVSSLATKLNREKITFGLHPDAHVRATEVENRGRDGMAYTLHIGNDNRPVVIRAIGRHNVGNSLAAAAIAHGAGADIDTIAEGLALFTPYEKRSRVEKLAGDIQVLNDCYNANPGSMLAALNTLHDLKQGHRAVAILGDMLELGDKSDTAHAKIGRKVSELGIDYLAAFGSQAQNMINSARGAGMRNEAAMGFSSKEDLVRWLHRLMEDGRISADDWLLIKGSRGMRMEEILELLHKEHKPN